MNKRYGRITGPDLKKKTPVQQTSMLGRSGDHIVNFPYGLYADLPDDAMVKEIDCGWAVPVTEKRPGDLKRSEPTFFHPSTNTRIIARNDGSLLIETGTGGIAPVVINCTQANINASESATINTPLATFTGDVQIDGALNTDGAATLGGDSGVGIARLGDEVTVGSSTGTITGSSSTNKAT
jgi:hypothetical protein